MGRHIFVTTEYDPLLPGGAGAVVGELSRRLVADGAEVVVLLVNDAPLIPNQVVDIRLVSPDDPDEGAPTRPLASSRSAALALAGLAPTPDDVVEFTDFWGLGYWALTHREELGLTGTRLGVRFHGPIDLIYESVGASLPAVDRHVEVDAYRLADFLLVPSAGMGDVSAERYGIAGDRIVVGELPVPPIDRVALQGDATPTLVCLGTVAEVKGSHDFLEAAIPILQRRPDAIVEFVGGEGWSITRSQPMMAVLRNLIPAELADRVIFKGRVPRDGFAEALRTASVVFFPSRFESFCLAAHEVRRMGLPVVVPDLPAFRAYFSEETGAASYDGSIGDLTATIETLLDDPERLARLAAAPAPVVGDPLAAYRQPFPPPRHAREQSGRAERSLLELQRMLAAPSRQGFLNRVASGILRVLPDSFARIAVQILPRRVKDRFRSVASWPVEAERRARLSRVEAVLARRDDFPDLDEPEVSVVIPCFNQGQFLTDALVSVFEQTLATFEVIVVDDGSTEAATLDILDALDFPRTRLIRQENRGLPGARNAGMAVARGKYLVSLDADDELTPTYLEELRDALEAHPEAAYAHCWAELFGNVSAYYATRPLNPYWLVRADSVIGCVMMRREAWEAVGGYDETMLGQPEDWELWVRFWKEGWDQVLVPEPLFRYRRHGVTLGVLGEINFERGRLAITERHPEVFAADAVEPMRRRWYPLLTIVGDSNPLPESAELVASHEDLATTWGKYVVDLRDLQGVAPGLLLRLAQTLEDNPDVGSARTTASPPLTMTRRWVLHDPNADPREVIDVDDPTPGSREHRRGSVPRSGWAIPESLRHAGIPVHRQKPEEDWPVGLMERSK